MWIGILGPLQVTFKSTPVRVPGLRQRRILATLALYANAPVPIDRLIDMLWAEAPPKTAREQIQNCTGQLARQLRRASGMNLITRNPGSYTLDLAPSALDALQLERSVRRGHELSKDGRHEEARRLYRAALDLWRGDVLVGVLTDGMQARITQLEELRTSAIEQYVEIALRFGDHHAAITELSEAVANQPFNEHLCELLMQSLRSAGRVGEALIVFIQTRDRLVRELDLQPGPALQALHREIMLSSPGPPLRLPSVRGPAPKDASLDDEPLRHLTPKPRPHMDKEAIRMMREATRLLSTAVRLLESSISHPVTCRRCPEQYNHTAA